MNRKDRRANNHRHHSAERIRDLQHCVNNTGQPGVIDGLHSACSDCGATGAFILLPGRQVIARIYHDDGCPVLNGTVTWAPVPITSADTT